MNKKLCKKGIALILAAVMILGCAPKFAHADGYDDTAPAYEVETKTPTQTEEENATETQTEAPTQASTEAPTEASTEAPVEEQPETPVEEPEKSTEAPAEETSEDKTEETEASTEASTEGSIESVAESTEESTMASTEDPTEESTEESAETPTEESTDYLMEESTEPSEETPTGPTEEEPTEPVAAEYSGEELTELDRIVPKTRAADNTVKANHGAVKIYNYDYDALVSRLTTKYPGIFKSVPVYSTSTHARIGTAGANCVLITNATNHRQNSNSGTTMKYLSGATRSTSNWGQCLGNFNSKEYFNVNGHRAYCFDITTSATAGSHVLSSSLSEAGINVQTGANVIELAQVAKMLTENDYTLIVQNASTFAKAVSIPAFTDPDRTWFSHGAVSISKNDVATLLRDTTADGLAFKRAMVQMLVWKKMNAISLSDWMYSFIADSGYYDKEGNWIPYDTPTLSGPIIGYAGIIDFDKMYQEGKEAWEEQKNSTTVDYEYQYELTVGVPFSVPTADVENVKKIVQANGNKIESSGTVTVNVTSSGVTLTATQPLTNWTEWLTTSESSNMIYSSKPYDPGHSGDPRYAGTGQFIVDVSEMKFMRARVKAEIPTGTVTITKSSANTTVTNGNSCYSLAGAKYGIYTDSACTTLAKDASGSNAILTTTANGSSNTLTINAGTYYIKEISPSPGYGLAAGTYPVTVTYNGNVSLSGSDSSIFKEPPLDDPAAIVIRKTAATAYSGADFDMSGAQYTIRYYAGQYTKDSLPSAPAAVWVIETKKVGNNYLAYLKDGFVIFGSPVYGTDASGNYIIPLGTLTIQETKAPAGFTIEGSTMQLANGNGSDATDGIALFNLVDQNSAATVISGNQADDTEEGIQILQKETVAAVDVKVVKTSDDGNVSGLSFTLSGTLLAGGTYSETKKTDANGKINFGKVPYGTYTMTENLTEEQAQIYLPNDPVSFTIDADTEDPYVVSFHNFVPEIETDAADTESGLNHIKADEKASVIDVVTYRNLIPGREYVVKGELYDKETGRSIGVTTETAFTPEKADGTVEVVFEFDATEHAGKALVAFEQLYYAGTRFAAHEDIDDDRQTIYVPEITTDAKDDATGTHEGRCVEKVTITDIVTYAGLEPGKEYTVKGILMDKASGNALLVDGKEVTSEKTFTPEAVNGTVEISFTFDSTALNGKTIVVFETLYYEGMEVAVHADINDENQAVVFPSIATKASDSGNGSSTLSGSRIRDKISYSGLTPGAKYVIVTRVYDKNAKNLLSVKKESDFTPEKASGATTVVIDVDTSSLEMHSLVVFEEIYLVTKDGRVLVAAHKDPNDKAQTLYVPGLLPKTGDESRLIVWGLMAASSLVGVFFILKKLAGKKKKGDVD